MVERHSKMNPHFLNGGAPPLMVKRHSKINPHFLNGGAPPLMVERHTKINPHFFNGMAFMEKVIAIFHTLVVRVKIFRCD